MKLLIGTIAHEANISPGDAVKLGEIDPLKVCQKDEHTVRELLWALVRIGILRITHKAHGLVENDSPSKVPNLGRHLGARIETPGSYVKETRMMSGESKSALCSLQKSLGRRRELAGIQTVFPRATSNHVKAYNWVQDLPSSFSTVSHTAESNDSTSEIEAIKPHTVRVHSDQRQPKITENNLRANNRNLQSAAQPATLATKSYRPPLSGLLSASEKVMPMGQTSRKSSQSLRPSSYPHAVYSISYEEMPIESADISPVPTVYLEHVSARIMELSSRLHPISRILVQTDNVSDTILPEPRLPVTQDNSRIVNGFSMTMTSLQHKNSDLISKRPDEMVTPNVRETKISIPIQPINIDVATSNKGEISAILDEKVNEVYAESGGVQLPLSPDTHRIDSYSPEHMGKVDQRNPTIGDDKSATAGFSELENSIGETHQNDEYDSDETGEFEDYVSEGTSNDVDSISDVIPTTAQMITEDDSASGLEQQNPLPKVPQSGGHSEDMRLYGESLLENTNEVAEASVDPQQGVHRPVASIKPSSSNPAIEMEVLDKKQPNGEKDDALSGHNNQVADESIDSPHIADEVSAVNVKEKIPQPLLIDITQLDIPLPPKNIPGEENLIDLLSDPIPIKLPDVLRAISPPRSWVSAPRDLASEGHSMTSKVNHSVSSLTNSHSLLNSSIWELSAHRQYAQNSEMDLACAAPLPESEASSIRSSAVSIMPMHHGVHEVDYPTEDNVSGLVSDACIPSNIPAVELLKPNEDAELNHTQGPEEENETTSSPVNRSDSPTGSESAWIDYAPSLAVVSNPRGSKASLDNILTSTPRKKNRGQIPSSSVEDANRNGSFSELEGEVAGGLTENLNALEMDSEMDELSEELSEYYISDQELSRPQTPLPLSPSKIIGLNVASLRVTPVKTITTQPQREDTPTRFDPNSSALNTMDSMWETTDNEEGEPETERPTTKGSNSSNRSGHSSSSSSIKQPRTQMMQAMQAIIQTWDQAGASQPSPEESEYLPDCKTDDGDDECDENGEFSTTLESGSEFSQAHTSGIDVFGDPHTPVPQSRQSQKEGSSLLSLSQPPHFSDAKQFQNPQSPYTPLRPRRLFSTPTGASTSLATPERSPCPEPGNITLPFAATSYNTLTHPPVLSRSLTIGGNLSRARQRPASMLNRAAPATTPDFHTATGSVSLPLIQRPRTQMSIFKPRDAPVINQTPRNKSLPLIEPSKTQMSKLKSRSTPSAIQATPSVIHATPSMYFTPRSNPGTMRKGAMGEELRDMDLSFGLM